MTDTQSRTIQIAVIGAGGKMGMRVSNNLAETAHTVAYVENSPAGAQRTIDAGRELTDAATAVADADIVVFAVPDLALASVTADLVPQMKSGAIALTLDPAAAYAGLLTDRDDVIRAVAHPCHPSIFLQRQTPEEWADTFGGIAAPQDAIAASSRTTRRKPRPSRRLSVRSTRPSSTCTSSRSSSSPSSSRPSSRPSRA